MTGPRPKLRDGEQQRHFVGTTLTDTEERKLKAIAKARGLSVSGALRLCITCRWANVEGDTAP